jgi:hypothetical protein
MGLKIFCGNLHVESPPEDASELLLDVHLGERDLAALALLLHHAVHDAQASSEGSTKMRTASSGNRGSSRMAAPRP